MILALMQYTSTSGQVGLSKTMVTIKLQPKTSSCRNCLMSLTKLQVFDESKTHRVIMPILMFSVAPPHNIETRYSEVGSFNLPRGAGTGTRFGHTVL